MRLDRLEAEVQKVGDLLVRVALSNQLQNLTLAVGEGCLLPPGTRDVRFKERLRYLACEEGFVNGKRFNRVHKVLFGIGLEHIAARPGVQQVLDQPLVVMHGEDQDFRLRQACPNFPRDIEAVG